MAGLVRHEVEDLDQLHNCSTSVKDPVKEMHCCHVMVQEESAPVCKRGYTSHLTDRDHDLDCSEDYEHDREGFNWALLNATDAMMRARLVSRLHN